MDIDDPPPPPPAVISTDRGSIGDGTAIMPPFRVDVETGCTVAWRERDGVDRRTINGPETLLRVGLVEDLVELRAIWAGHVDVREEAGGARGGAHGLADVALGLKLKLLDQTGLLPRTVLIGQTFIGAGDAEVTGGVDPTVKAAFSWDLGDGWGVLGNLGASWISDGAGHVAQGLGSLLVSFAPLEATTLFAEYGATFPAARGDDAAHVVDVGVWQRLGPSVQLDLRVAFGLGGPADDLAVGAGVSFLF